MKVIILIVFFSSNAKKTAGNMKVPDQSSIFTPSEIKELRWFLLPSESKTMMSMFKKFGNPWTDRFSILFYEAPDESLENPIGSLGGDAVYPQNKDEVVVDR